MNPIPRLLCLAAALWLGAAGSAGAQQPTEADDVPLYLLYEGEHLSSARAQVVARATLAQDQVDALKASGIALQTFAFAFKGGPCYVEIGTALPRQGDRMPRQPSWRAWAMAERRAKEAPALTCERAMGAALKDLADTGEALTPAQLKVAAQRTADPARPRFESGQRRKGVVNHNHEGLSDFGKQSIADTLGDRWTLALDHRKFSAFVYMRQTKTVEGHAYCLLLSGLTANQPEGVNVRMPANLYARYVLADGPTADCANKVFNPSLEALHADFQDDLDDFFKYGTETGQSYPAASEIRKIVAKYDADQRRKEQAPARPVAATTSSRNVLRCSNDCVNGSCVRTFEDGRKERWQAPRRFNPLTNNWEWDTVTNACGG